MLRKALPLLLLLSGTPSHAEGTGTIAALDLAARLYAHGIAADDAVAVVTAFHLSQGITLREATGWTRGTAKATDDGAPSGPADTAATVIVAGAMATANHTPAPPLGVLTDEIKDAAFLMAEGNEDLTEIAEITATHSYRDHTGAANRAEAELAPGMADIWEIPFSGQVRAEIGVFGDGNALGLRVADAGGSTVCLALVSTGPLGCAFTPAENSFFTVTVVNRSAAESRYMLLAN